MILKNVAKNKKWSLFPLSVFCCIAIAIAPSKQAKAVDFADYLKGCVVVGSAGVGSVALAAGLSNSKQAASMSAIMVGGALTCAIGAYLSSDAAKKGETDTSGQFLRDYRELNSKLNRVNRDLCLIKRECGPDGQPINKQARPDMEQTAPLQSGNELP